MNRRDFLTLAGAAVAAGVSMWQAPAMAAAATPAGRKSATGYANVLILVELKGGNDGLNTVVPYADPLYYPLRRSIGIKRDQVLQLDAQTGLHPSLAPLMPLWRDGQVAVVQGAGTPVAGTPAAGLRGMPAKPARGGLRFDLERWLGQYRARPQAIAGLSTELQLQHAVLQLSPVAAIDTDSTGSAYLEALLMDPAYQLK